MAGSHKWVTEAANTLRADIGKNKAEHVLLRLMAISVPTSSSVRETLTRLLAAVRDLP